MDGAHGYPVACMDIINSLKLIGDNGIILCDDVLLNSSHSTFDKMYTSLASWQTLEELRKQNLLEYELIYKRLDSENNCIEKNRNFVAIVKKINKAL